MKTPRKGLEAAALEYNVPKYVTGWLVSVRQTETTSNENIISKLHRIMRMFFSTSPPDPLSYQGEGEEV